MYYQHNGMIITSTGKRETLKNCSISRKIYKVVDYQGYGCTFPNDEVYLFPSDVEELKEVQYEPNTQG